MPTLHRWPTTSVHRPGPFACSSSSGWPGSNSSQSARNACNLLKQRSGALQAAHIVIRAVAIYDEVARDGALELSKFDKSLTAVHERLVGNAYALLYLLGLGQELSSVLFVDEINAISANRVNAQDMERRVVVQLVSSLNGLPRIESGDEVLVIGATNRHALDPALRRVGRFDQEILLGILDREAVCHRGLGHRGVRRIDLISSCPPLGLTLWENLSLPHPAHFETVITNTCRSTICYVDQSQLDNASIPFSDPRRKGSRHVRYEGQDQLYFNRARVQTVEQGHPNHAAIFAGPNSGQHLPERAIIRSVGQHLVANHVVHTRTSTSPAINILLEQTRSHCLATFHLVPHASYNHVAVDDHLFTCEGRREAFGRSRPRVSPAGPTGLVANIWAVIDITRSPPKASSDDKTPNSRRRTQLWGSPAFLPAAARASSGHVNINSTSGSEKNDKRKISVAIGATLAQKRECFKKGSVLALGISSCRTWPRKVGISALHWFSSTSVQLAAHHRGVRRIDLISSCPPLGLTLWENLSLPHPAHFETVITNTCRSTICYVDQSQLDNASIPFSDPRRKGSRHVRYEGQDQLYFNRARVQTVEQGHPNHAAIFAGPNSGQHLPERAIIRSVGQHLVANHVVHTRTSTSPAINILLEQTRSHCLATFHLVPHASYNHVAVDDHLFTCEGRREAFGRSRPRVSPAGPTGLVANIWAVIDITRSPPKASSDDKTPNSRRRTQLWGSPAFLPAAARASSGHVNINSTSGSEKNDKRKISVAIGATLAQKRECFKKGSVLALGISSCRTWPRKVGISALHWFSSTSVQLAAHRTTPVLLQLLRLSDLMWFITQHIGAAAVAIAIAVPPPRSANRPRFDRDYPAQKPAAARSTSQRPEALDEIAIRIPCLDTPDYCLSDESNTGEDNSVRMVQANLKTVNRDGVTTTNAGGNLKSCKFYPIHFLRQQNTQQQQKNDDRGESSSGVSSDTCNEMPADRPEANGDSVLFCSSHNNSVFKGRHLITRHDNDQQLPYQEDAARRRSSVPDELDMDAPLVTSPGCRDLVNIEPAF
ncbi:peroxisome assembly factor-2 [Culex quinquefasciatus]|uniref:Peroxisome assembly factor-2 n=1 Tax=Culex quinquefasciatus TaxID=7176 RepID=B0WQP4_CULQU|nr:peroxisome assembly factor-2 [Culex quinquefasciatus]|eukprot:XP_001851028.1 peroxisome assembly factor-2 [Culex quinquefasciatus]